MDPRRITQQILQYKPIGYRDIGRLRWRCEEDLWNGTGHDGLPWRWWWNTISALYIYFMQFVQIIHPIKPGWK
jgi:hypothetical protein